jgi:hypothetical protein
MLEKRIAHMQAAKAATAGLAQASCNPPKSETQKKPPASPQLTGGKIKDKRRDAYTPDRRRASHIW